MAILIPLFLVAYGEGDMQTDLLILLVYIACVTIGFYVDYIQSAVLASLTGMLVSTYIFSQLDARLYGGMVFLTIQISTYVITLVAGIVVAPMLFNGAGITGLLADMGVPVIALAVFCCAREGIIIGLSGLVNHRLKSA